MTDTTQAGLRARISTEDLKRLLAEATPGPWKADDKHSFGDVYVRHDPANWNGNGHLWLADVNGGYRNANLIALVPDLAAEVLELRGAPTPHGITNIDEVEVGKPVVLRLWDNGAGACYFEPFTPPAPQETAPVQFPLPDAHGGCACPCHTTPGVMHMAACCHPERVAPQDRIDRVLKSLDYWGHPQDKEATKLIRDLIASPPPSAAPTDNTALVEAAKAEGFNTGYLIACCNIQNLHGEAPIAFDVLAQLGVSRAEVRRMDLSEYDAAALRKIEKSRNGSVYADGRKGIRAALARCPAAPRSDADVAVRPKRGYCPDCQNDWKHHRDYLGRCPNASEVAGIVMYGREPAHPPHPDVQLKNAVIEAIDLLTERKHGPAARSPSHNARLVLEAALTDPANNRSAGEGMK